jgi:phosphate:Na+ symporter
MWNALVVPLVGGLVVMLIGMKLLEWALQQMAERYLRELLLRVTRTPWRGLLTGTVVTALTQSSTALTVIAIGLVDAGAMRFGQTLGLLLGANVGTCLTTELVSWHIQPLAWPMLCASGALGVVLLLLVGNDNRWAPLRTSCFAISGFAGVLLGIAMMQSIAPWLRCHGLFATFVAYAQHHTLAGVTAGAALAALLHSSAATIALAMALCGTHAIGLPLAIAVVLGANIGTCATGLLAAIGASKPARQVAYAQLFLNAAGTLLFLPLIPLLQLAVTTLSHTPSSQVAHAQTIFNVICSLLALPLCYLRRFNN